jgi:uncharacterized LabA/DUF88 family protein
VAAAITTSDEAEVAIADPGTVSLLVDFDNLNDRRGTADASVQVSAYLNRTIRLVAELTLTTEIDVRLYGGWLQKGVTTRLGSEVAAAVEVAGLLPTRHPVTPGLLRGGVRLATSLLAVPSTHWPDTFANVAGPQRVRLSRTPRPDGCDSADDNCVARRVMKFTKGQGAQCPEASCGLTAGDAFVHRRQKMVDTMIACDVLELSRDRAPVVVVTSDLDLLPPVVRAALEGSDVHLVQPWDRIEDEHIRMLTAMGVHVHELGI